MTISTLTTRVSYAGDGSTTAFPVPFPFFGTDELEVIERVIATGVETVKTLTTHYAVSGGNGATGTVTAAAAPASTVQWVIRRKTRLTQEIDYTANDPFPAETHERGLDRALAINQEQSETLDRSIKLPKTDPEGTVTTLPAIADRAGKTAGFDASGNFTALTQVSDDALFFAASIATFAGDGATASFALSFGSGQVPAKFWVLVNRVPQKPTTDYTISGGNLVFVAAPLAGAEIECRYMAAVSLGYTPAPADALKVLRVNAAGTDIEAITASGTGDVVGPAGATDRALALYGSATGKLLKNGPALGTVGHVLVSGGAGADPAFGQVGSGGIAAGAVGPTELAATAVTPGSYTNCDLTVDADGRITAAANGSGGGGGGAPDNAEYLVAAANGTLTAERAMTDTATVAWDFATAAQAKANVPDAAITLAKLANLAQHRIIGRISVGAGVPEALTGDDARAIIGALSAAADSVQDGFFGNVALRDDTNPSHYLVLTAAVDLSADRTLSINTGNADRILAFAGDATISGTNTGDQTITLTGNVTGSGTGSFAATIAADAVANTMLRNSAALSVIGRSANSSGDPADIAAAANDRLLARTGDTLAFQQLTVGMVPDGTLTLAKIANIATARLLGRSTAGAGVPEELTVGAGLTLAAGQLSASGASATILKQTAGGRLTLATGVPVMTSDQAAKTTVFYTPYVGDQIALYDGAAWDIHQFTELSQATTDATKSPAAVANNSNYDVFVWDDGGTLRATRGPAWTSATARGTGAGTTELELFEGAYVNKVAITNGPAARCGRYVGSVRSDGSAQINFTLGAIAAGGTEAKLHVWNQHNRAEVAARVGDTANSWTYATATIRAANNSSTFRVSFLCGLAEDAFRASYTAHFNSSAIGTLAKIGIGYDATSAFTGFTAVFSNSNEYAGSAHDVRVPGLGSRFVSAVEYASAATATFYGDNATPSTEQGGLAFTWRI